MKEKILGCFNFIAAAFIGLTEIIIVGCPALRYAVTGDGYAAFFTEYTSYNTVQLIHFKTASISGGAMASGVFNIIALILGIVLFIVGAAGFLSAFNMIGGRDLSRNATLDKAVLFALTGYAVLSLLSLASLGAFVSIMRRAGYAFSLDGAVICMSAFSVPVALTAWIIEIVNRKRAARQPQV